MGPELSYYITCPSTFAQCSYAIKSASPSPQKKGWPFSFPRSSSSFLESSCKRRGDISSTKEHVKDAKEARGRRRRRRKKKEGKKVLTNQEKETQRTLHPPKSSPRGGGASPVQFFFLFVAPALFICLPLTGRHGATFAKGHYSVVYGRKFCIHCT